MEALRLPQDFPPLRVPDAAKHEKVNVEALVSYKISADGLLQDAKVLYDPGYGCGAAAKEYIENQKYWAPRCLARCTPWKRLIPRLPARLANIGWSTSPI
jgi:hypothetical protein